MVAIFCLAVHNGGDMSEALNIARRITKPHDIRFHELSEPGDKDSESLNDEVKDFAVSVKRVLSMMTDEYCVSQAMAKYPQAPHSDLVSTFLSFLTRMLLCWKW